MTVAVEGLTKRFGAFTALNDVTLHARRGEFLALLGPSGSGKTTLLRIMAGLEFPDTGVVRFDGEDVSSRPTGERRVGFVFQHYALFRHMSVAKNVAFGLEVKPAAERPSKATIAARVKELLDLVQLGHLGDRYPAQLSGGQRQRVALARALAVGPRILLLDEPFGALDAKVRKELRRWLRRVHDEMGLTSVFVTHDQEEALELADRVVVMNNARIEQLGTPREVYETPATAFVCEFLGQANRFDCRIEDGEVRLGTGHFANLAPPVADGPAIAFIRAHDLALAPADTPGGLPAQAQRLTRTGALTTIDCAWEGRTVEASSLDVPDWAVPGVSLALIPRAVRAYPRT